MSTIAEPLVYTIAEACRVSTLSKSQIYNLARAGKLEIRKIGRRSIVPVSSLVAILEGKA